MRGARRRLLAALAAMAVVAAACVQQDAPGLTISELEASLVFGIDEQPEPGATPVEATLGFPQLDIPDLFVPEPRPFERKPFVVDVPAEDPCPGARNVATVEFGAIDNVTTEGPGNRPVEGVYRWRRLVASGGRDAEPVEQGFELRAIRNVTDVPESQWSSNPLATSAREVFTFEEVRNLSFVELVPTSEGVVEELVERFLITTFLVDTEALRARVSQTDVVTQLPSTGNPNRGVTLMSSITVDGDGDQPAGTDAFEPSNGLALLPLPFVSGESYRTAATDASHGRTVVNDTTVNPRDRFNACGDMMEGFRVNVSQTVSTTSSSSPSRVFEVDYIIAPQHGGVVISENVYDNLSGNRVLLHQAQLHPDPLPADGLPR